MPERIKTFKEFYQLYLAEHSKLGTRIFHFLGILIILLVLFYAIYIGRIFYLAETQKNTFNRVFGYCFAGILLMHFSINLGMVMGLFPTVGIPLPYFSYGGSSFLAFSIMTAIFFKLNYADKNSLV